MDYSFQTVVPADATFYGRLTNETRKLNKKQAMNKGLTYDLYLFPWENLEEEWTTVQAKQFPYEDVKEAKKNSEFSVELKEE